MQIRTPTGDTRHPAWSENKLLFLPLGQSALPRCPMKAPVAFVLALLCAYGAAKPSQFCDGTLVVRQEVGRRLLWSNAVSGEPTRWYPINSTEICTKSFAVDGNMLWCIDSNATIHSFELTNGVIQGQLPIHVQYPRANLPSIDADAKLMYWHNLNQGPSIFNMLCLLASHSQDVYCGIPNATFNTFTPYKYAAGSYHSASYVRDRQMVIGSYRGGGKQTGRLELVSLDYRPPTRSFRPPSSATWKSDYVFDELAASSAGYIGYSDGDLQMTVFALKNGKQRDLDLPSTGKIVELTSTTSKCQSFVMRTRTDVSTRRKDVLKIDSISQSEGRGHPPPRDHHHPTAPPPPTMSTPNSSPNPIAETRNVMLPSSIVQRNPKSGEDTTMYIGDASGMAWTPLLFDWPANNPDIPIGLVINFEPFQDNATEPESSDSGCQGSPPNDLFTCVDGVWWANMSVVAPSISVSGRTSLGGSVYVDFSTTFNGLRSSLSVDDCYAIEGNILLDLSSEDYTTLTKKGSTELHLVQGQRCADSQTALPLSLANPPKKSCKKVTLKTEQKGNGVYALVQVDSMSCNLWWIILISVVAFVVLSFIVLIFTFTYFKSCRQRIRPYSS